MNRATGKAQPSLGAMDVSQGLIDEFGGCKRRKDLQGFAKADLAPGLTFGVSSLFCQRHQRTGLEKKVWQAPH